MDFPISASWKKNAGRVEHQLDHTLLGSWVFLSP